jgi:2Fe-2S ferredoxin
LPSGQVIIDEAWIARLPPPSTAETELLEVFERPEARLSCQIKISSSLDGLVVRVPESQYE